MITEADLLKAVDIIKSSMEDLDKVRVVVPFLATPVLSLWTMSMLPCHQLEDIPGEVESEKGHKDTLTN